MANYLQQANAMNSGQSETTSMVVPINQIQPYERNPRHGSNPEYDRIKASIRIQGLDQPLVITQRPGKPDYIVHSGGNTRLLILKELFEETGNDHFSRVQCHFKPWNRESDVLLAHLRENDLRGSLSFIDKARAVFETRKLLAEELELDEVSQRRLESELQRAGYSISHGLISQMEYAVDRLLPLIPLALENGLGRPQVLRIRCLEKAAGALWQRRCSGEANEFDAIFATLCSRYDGPDWDGDSLRSALETEIAEEAEISIHTIRVALDAELDGRELVIPEFVPIKEPPKPSTQGDSGGKTVTTEGLGDLEIDEDTLNQSGEAPAELTHTEVQFQDLPDAPNTNDSEPLIDEAQSRPVDLKSLRGRAWTLATRLAQRNGIKDLVEPLSGKGLGFVLRDVPDPSLADQLDEDALAQICILWWQLAACSEMTFAPLESIVPILPADSVLRRALEEEDAELLFNSIWTLDPGHTGYRLWQSLHDQDWRDLVNLMDTYRHIRQLAAETGIAIWD